jgi:hypothetical protein
MSTSYALKMSSIGELPDRPGSIMIKFNWIFVDETLLWNTCRNHNMVDSQISRLFQWIEQLRLEPSLRRCAIPIHRNAHWSSIARTHLPDSNLHMDHSSVSGETHRILWMSHTQTCPLGRKFCCIPLLAERFMLMREMVSDWIQLAHLRRGRYSLPDID